MKKNLLILFIIGIVSDTIGNFTGSLGLSELMINWLKVTGTIIGLTIAYFTNNNQNGNDEY